MTISVVVVEDESLVCELYVQTLVAAAFDAVGVPDAAECRKLLNRRRADVVMIDLGLPGMDGISLARELRAQHHGMGLMIVSRRGTPEERIEALDLGCDDYLVKPVHLGELCARVQAVARRRASRHRLRFGAVTLDLDARSVTAGEAVIPFTRGEFTIISLLAEAEGRAMARDVLAEAVRRHDSEAEPRTVDALIRRIRRKLDHVAPEAIVTVPGIGYRLGTPVITV